MKKDTPVTVKKAQERMSRRRDRFIVGYLGPKNVAFGVPDKLRGLDSAQPLTRKQAEALLSEMPSSRPVLFELVPVKVRDN